jgi:hypothetical protein
MAKGDCGQSHHAESLPADLNSILKPRAFPFTGDFE